MEKCIFYTFCLNRPITTNGIELVIKKLPTNQSPKRAGCTGELYSTSKAELTPFSSKYSKSPRGGMAPKLISQGHGYPDCEARQRHHRRGKPHSMGKANSFACKITATTRMPTVTPCIRRCTGSPRHNSQTRQRNTRLPDGKGRRETAITCR